MQGFHFGEKKSTQSSFFFISINLKKKENSALLRLCV